MHDDFEVLEATLTRVGIRQSLARDKNEQNKARPSSSFVECGCECASRACDQLLSVTAEEYEQVRRIPTHFLVAWGHVEPRAEFVVRQTAEYQVVEKFGVAAEVAVRLDPRLLEKSLSELGS